MTCVGDHLSCELNVAVVPNKKNKFVLVGKDLMGEYSMWMKAAQNDPLGCLISKDNKLYWDIV